MKDKKDSLKKVGWLLAGLVLWYLSGGDQPVWIAVWLAPVFIMRFFRETGHFKAFFIALPGIVAMELTADWGMMPFPSFKILLLYTSLSVVFILLPYLIDGLMKRFLPIGFRIFLFPALAIAIPFALGSGGTWGARANGMEDLAMLQLVSLTGISGISFLVYWTASLINEIWEYRKNLPKIRIHVITFILILIFVYSFGLIRLRSNYNPAKFMKVAGIVHDPSTKDTLVSTITTLVRTGSEKTAKTEAIRHNMVNQFHRLLSDSLSLADSGFELAVWGEGAALLFEEDEPQLIRLAAEKAKEKNIYLGIAVAVYQNKSRNPKPGIQPLFRNKLILISPTGVIAWEYEKGILAPGMEAAITIPGDTIMKVTESGHGITGAICYELDFPRHIRQAALLNAGLLLGPANDWGAIKNIHARMARLRAIEAGVSLLRPTNSGISIATDPYGRILSRVDTINYKGAYLTAVVPLVPIPTIYSALGDYFNWLCLVLALATLTFGILNRIKRK